MAIRMQQRRGTAEQWTSSNPVLSPGEVGFETDNSQFKIGDGVNQWNDLAYFVNADGISGTLGDYIELAEKGTADGVATLDAQGQVPANQLGNATVDLSDYATETYVDTAVSTLVDAAPAALNTLNELAAALGDDANYASTITTALGTKAPTADPTFTGTVSGVTKTHVGLANVDNTSDANKPVSTATQTALDGKADVTHAHGIEDLTDFEVASPDQGQTLVYNGTKWENATVSSGVNYSRSFLLMGA
jgi:hypothetical protein